MPQSDRLLMGVIAGPRGVRGEVKVKSFTEVPEDLLSYGPLEDKTGNITYKMKLVGVSKSMPVVRMEGVGDRNKAETLKGTELYISRDKLPETDGEEEFYHTDLMGLKAVHSDGTGFGKILRVFDFGAGDMLEIVPDGKGAKASVLIPFVREMVPTVDLKAGHVVLELPEDFFDVPEKETEKNEDSGE